MTKNTFKDAVKIVLGVLFLSAGVAYAGTWTPPPTTPIPSGFPYNNVDMPINVGAATQTKTGPIWASMLGSNGGGYINGLLQIKGGSPGIGKVLTSTDVNGNAVWDGVGISEAGTLPVAAGSTSINKTFAKTYANKPYVIVTAVNTYSPASATDEQIMVYVRQLTTSGGDIWQAEFDYDAIRTLGGGAGYEFVSTISKSAEINYMVISNN